MDRRMFMNVELTVNRATAVWDRGTDTTTITREDGRQLTYWESGASLAPWAVLSEYNITRFFETWFSVRDAVTEFLGRNEKKA